MRTSLNINNGSLFENGLEVKFVVNNAYVNIIACCLSDADSQVQTQGCMSLTTIVVRVRTHRFRLVFVQTDSRELKRDIVRMGTIGVMQTAAAENTRVKSLLLVSSMWDATQTKNTPPISRSKPLTIILCRDMQTNTCTVCRPSSVSVQIAAAKATIPSLLSRALTHAGAAIRTGSMELPTSDCVERMKTRAWPCAVVTATQIHVRESMPCTA